MVNVGIVGLGSNWENRYRPVLKQLAARIRVRRVFDPVQLRAEQVARDLGCEVAGGLVALADQRDIQAILLLDNVWMGEAAVHLLAGRGKPLFMVPRLNADLHVLDRLHAAALADGKTLMPAFGERYTPATCRLHELMATQLGPPHLIRVTAAIPANSALSSTADFPSCTHEFIDWADWLRYVVRSSPARVEVAAQAETAAPGKENLLIRIEYRPRRNHAVAPVAELTLCAGKVELPASSVQKSPQAALPDPGLRRLDSGVWPAARPEIICQNGSAVIEGPAALSWQSQGETRTELLSAERCELQVMLDHFCRRVVGGLIPLPDINDICRGLRMAESARQSLASGQPVALDGQV